jgi:hypothetical protein
MGTPIRIPWQLLLNDTVYDSSVGLLNLLIDFYIIGSRLLGHVEFYQHGRLGRSPFHLLFGV